MTPGDLEAVKQFIVNTPVFAGLEEPALSRVASIIRQASFPKGSIIFSVGDTGHEMYVIRSGDIEATKISRGGRPVVISRLGVGDVFGDMTLIDMQPRATTTRATADTELYVLGNKEFYDLYRGDIRTYLIIGQNITRELARRLRRAHTVLCDLVDEVEDLKSSSGVSSRSPDVADSLSRRPAG
jgi:CRP/FNR family cyclic AMP-dependent transcriptional regulator